MSFKLPDLPYAYDALEPYIDSTTMQLHHTKHHAAYITKLNDAITGGQLQNAPADDLVSIQRSITTAQPPVIRNNGGGHYNHALFWKWMAPVGTSNVRPHGKLAEVIDQSFGSFDAMRGKFNEAAAARFGSGWAWLGLAEDGSLKITSTANQDNPLMKGVVDQPLIPILGLDVWEHAYYLKYQNRRPEYIEKWWNVVNWDYVVQCYDDFASKGKPVSF